MYKIKYKETGHVFELPDDTASELKEKYPNDYQILEKNGKLYKDTKKQKKEENSIRDKIVE